jgi:gas vesicle protein
VSTFAWILAGTLVVAVLVVVALALALRRAQARAVRTEQLVSEARRAVRAAAEEVSATQAEQLRVAIMRAQADSLSAYVSEERRLSDQRRGELAVRERELSEQMAELVSAVEQRVEERLRAWESDLERAQNALQSSVATLEQRMRQRIAEVESRVSSEADELDSTIDGQRAAALRLREELETSARDALARSLDEVQLQADDRRRTIDELNERLRQHEHAVTEQVDHAESEARTRIELAFGELERRQAEHIERALAREIDTRAEAGALEYENRMRAIREEAADRLREELDRIAESFLRRADGLIASELQQAVTAASQRIDDRLIELARQYESSARSEAR